MKKIKMLKTMSSPTISAHVGQVINVEDEFAKQLLEAKACVVLENIIDVDYVEVKEKAVHVSEIGIEKAVKPFVKKRR